MPLGIFSLRLLVTSAEYMCC